MANITKTATLSLALLCLLLLSEVGMLIAEVHTPPGPVAPVAPAGAPVVGDVCPGKCAKRCSKSGRAKRCNRTCIACCQRCPDRCVPSTPEARKDTCRCYSQIMFRGKPKCP